MAVEGTTDKPFFDALLSEGNIFWPAIMRYNAHPCGQSKALQPFCADVRSSLNVWLAGIPDKCRDYIDEPETNFFWDFADDSRKIALLDDRQIARLADVTGVTLHARELAQVVQREERQICCEELGKDLFNYAQTRGQYQAGTAGDLVKKRDTSLSLTARCRLHGRLALYLCSMRWPEELRVSFQRRLEAMPGMEIPDISLNDSLNDKDWRALWRMLKKCLLREVEPSWKPYFTA
ncbi:MAG: hypothetical protein K5657_05275 [Desulfovibrio sp.]|nr:hypothetical protein [Desulfovibrio sp.]